LGAEVRIPLSRKKMALITLGSVLFVAAGAFFALYDSPKFGMKARVAGWASVVFFGVCGVYASARAVKPGSAVVISAAGIEDNSSGLAAGFIPWVQVARVELISFQGQNFVGITLQDVEQHIGRLGPIKARATRWNLSRDLPPVLIPQVSIKILVSEVARLIEEYRQSPGERDDGAQA
jgi:hypothetical protein